MPYPGRQNIYEATIRRMVTQALEAQETAFDQAHGTDSDEALLEYLASCAQQLGHSPWPREIPGGGLIGQRFGDWERALTLAGLPSSSTPDKYQSFARVREETLRQRELYRQRQEEKRELQKNQDGHR